MTREEAQKELAELEPKEATAWKAVADSTAIWEAAYDDIRRLMDNLIADKPGVIDPVHKRWYPLHARKQQLKAFLEMIQ